MRGESGLPKKARLLDAAKDPPVSRKGQIIAAGAEMRPAAFGMASANHIHRNDLRPKVNPEITFQRIQRHHRRQRKTCRNRGKRAPAGATVTRPSTGKETAKGRTKQSLTMDMLGRHRVRRLQNQRDHLCGHIWSQHGNRPGHHRRGISRHHSMYEMM